MKHLFLKYIPVVVKEFSTEFLQGMIDRMTISFYKYGPVRHGFPDKVDAIATLKIHLKEYERTGNREILMDLSNYAMIEFMHPKHPDAHYKPRDSQHSLGRIFDGEINPVQDPNVPKRRD